MNKATLAIIVFSVAALLGGCESLSKAMGYGKRPPDEFAVYSRAPLSLPPDYALRPPRPGVTTEATPSEGGLLEVLKKKQAPTREVQAGPGVQALLRETGALDADPNIRAEIDRETSIMTKDNKGVTERILFFSAAGSSASVIDPVVESRRIRENQALGRPITAGETPTIETGGISKPVYLTSIGTRCSPDFNSSVAISRDAGPRTSRLRRR